MNLNTPYTNYRKRALSAGASRTPKSRENTRSQDPTPVSPKAQQDTNTKHQQKITKYSVLFRKWSTKKNKTWENDGILTYNSLSNIATIKNDDGIVIGKLKDADKLIFKGVFKCSGMEFELSDEIISSKMPKVMSSSTNLNVPIYKSSIFKSPLVVKPSISTTSNKSTFTNSNKKNSVPTTNILQQPNLTQLNQKSKNILIDAPLYDVSNIENPLFMPDLPRSIDESEKSRKVVVDPSISVKLRQHQRDGITFLYSCLMGLKSDDIRGAILADEMGLGKTLQTITLIHTLLRQSPIVGSKPVINKVLICCPVSLVNNWKNEFSKWLGLNRLNVLTINSNKYQNEKQDIELFGRNNVYQVMIIGYEKMQSMSDSLSQIRFDLLVCDEGHRLKNSENKTMKTLESFNIRRRILLSGTPIQNDLVEFYTMANFTNPGILGDLKKFQKDFVKPILDSRDPNCTNPLAIKKGREQSQELVKITKTFLLRRSNLELTKYLPKRSDYIILAPPTPLQLQLLKTVCDTKKFKKLIESESLLSPSSGSFNLINTFRKICNSPSLLKDDGFFLEICEKNSNSLEDTNFRQQLAKKVKSGKLLVLIKLLGILHSIGDEKVVVVSNFTSTLDIIESLFKSLNLVFLRLDGSTPSSERSKIVDKFNKFSVEKSFALLLSAKAGGVGLNLVGASRIILYDNDWNPAVDLQAIARIHRDGQKREVKTYRLLTDGCIDEKIFQRQLVKQDLSDRFVDQKGGEKELFDRTELKDIFNVQFDHIANVEYCNTHEMMMCKCKGDGSIMIDGKYYNDDSSDDDSNEETNLDEDTENNELMSFMPALTYTRKYPNQNNIEKDRSLKQKKIRRCMKGYRHLNPLSPKNGILETEDSVLDLLINGQDKEKPLVSFVFGKY